MLAQYQLNVSSMPAQCQLNASSMPAQCQLNATQVGEDSTRQRKAAKAA
jgi:hypothetical protein